MTLRHPFYLSLAVLLFAMLEGLLMTFIDRPLSSSLHMLDVNHPTLIDFFRAYTDFGKSVWYLWPAGLGALFCALGLRFVSLPETVQEPIAKIGKALLFLFICVALAGLITDLIKPILGRARPVILEREGIYGFHPFTFHATWNSMPSGHATTAFALAFVLTILLPRGQKIWLGLAIILAASRVMVNAHFLSDICAGGAVAWGSVRILHDLFQKAPLTRALEGLFPFKRSLS